MPKPSNHDPIAERLAAFADQLMAGEQPGLDTDPELRDLQETAVRLQALIGSESDPARSARILRNVRAAARRAPARPAWQPWVRGLSYAGMAVILLAAALLMPDSEILSGSAGSISPLLPAGIFVVVVLVVSLIFWLRRKK